MFVIKSNTAKKTYLKIIEVKDHETQVEIISEQDNMASINGKIVELVVGSWLRVGQKISVYFFY